MGLADWGNGKEASFPRKQVVQGEAGGGRSTSGLLNVLPNMTGNESDYKPGKTVSVQTFFIDSYRAEIFNENSKRARTTV